MRLESHCLILLGLVGCSVSDESADGYMDEDFPPWNCDTEATGPECGSSSGSSGAAQGPCQSSLDCAGEAICAADFDGEIGTFECQESCIGAMDEQRWCSDVSSCCDSHASCIRGYCIPTDGATSSGTEESSGSGADTSTGSTGATGTSDTTSGDATTSSGGSSGG